MKTALSLLVLLVAPLLSGGEVKKNTVATYGDVSISAEELDRVVGNRLMRIRTEEYNIRKAALEELISERLVAAEAKRRGMTPAELLQAEVDGKVPVPSAAEVEPFYEGTKERYGNLPKDEAIQMIVDGMRRQKSTARLMEFHRELREAAKVRLTLDVPRIALKADGPARGNADAPVTIVMFSDFECTFCGRAAATVRQLESKYPNDVKVVYRDFPLPNHRGAPRAAEAAHCAGDQGKYWEMNERIFSKAGSVAEADLRRYAVELELDLGKWAGCLDGGAHTATWKAAHAEGVAAGVQSTPTFFINGRMIAGAAPYESFAKVVEEELARTERKAERRQAMR